MRLLDRKCENMKKVDERSDMHSLPHKYSQNT